MNIEIAPGAALADPELQRVIQLRCERNRGRAEALALRNILAHYPWTNYHYKYGRWESVNKLFDFGYPRYKWSKTFHVFRLIDPATGQPVGEMVARGGLTAPSGTLRFAGEPSFAGAYIATPGDPAAVHFTWSSFVKGRATVEAAQRLRPGQVPMSERAAQRAWMAPEPARGPWIADHPDKPQQKPGGHSQ